MDKLRKRNQNLTSVAKIKKSEMNAIERKLWFNFLKRYPVRILRQKVVGNYVADFYCARARLIIEINKGFFKKAGQRIPDAERTRVLTMHGLDEIRFSNEELENNFEGVCQKIDEVIQARM